MSLMHQAGVQSANQLGLSWVEFFDDFMGSSVFIASVDDDATSADTSLTPDISAWVSTIAGSTSIALSVQIPDTGTTGELLLFSTNTDDLSSVQLNGSTVSMAAGKRLIFEARVKVENITDDNDQLFGLCEVSTTPLLTTGLPLNADFVGFNKVGASADVDIVTQTATASATITTGAGTFVADTYTVLRFEWDGVSKVRFFQDGAKIGESSTNLPTTATLMKPTFATQAAAAGDFDFTIDYIYLAAQR